MISIFATENSDRGEYTFSLPDNFPKITIHDICTPNIELFIIIGR